MNNNITTVLLVRHADIDIPPNTSDDNNIHLNSRGEKRAKYLAEIVRKAPIAAVYTSTALRTIQTAKPLLEMTSIENKAIDEYEKIVENIITNYKGKVVLLVYHTPSIPKIIQSFTGESDHIVNGFDDFYIINFCSDDNSENKHGNVIHLRYDI